MRTWISKFFAVDNTVNEDTVLGCIFAVAFLLACFCPPCSGAIIPTGSAMGAFFGKNIFKKEVIDGTLKGTTSETKSS